MLDNITVKFKIEEKQYINACKLLGIPCIIDSEKNVVDYHNIRLTYFPNSGILRIQNSFHKLYNKIFLDIEGNHTDFSLSNFICIVHFLFNGIFQIDIKDVSVSSRTEFGINLDPTPYRSFSLISKFISHASTHINDFYTVPPFRGKPLQRVCYLNDYRIKVYDKGLQSQNSKENLLRYEVVIMEIRKLESILEPANLSLDTLTSTSTWDRLFDFLLTTYRQIRKVPQMPTASLTVEEINRIYGYCSTLMRTDIQSSYSRHHFTKINIENRHVYEKYNTANENFFNELFERIKHKRHILINSPC